MKACLSVIGLFLLFLQEVCFGATPKIRFGLLADIQYADTDQKMGRYYRNSLVKLDSCIRAMNQREVDFIVNLGDLIDNAPADIPPVMDHLNRAESKIYNITGNHDYKGMSDEKQLFRTYGMPSKGYYSFRRKNWRFIFLNTNDIASYSHGGDSAKMKELGHMKSNIRVKHTPNGASYNGGVGRKQMDWLREELNKARQRHENVMVFAHHPVHPMGDYCALNATEIRDLLAEYVCVKAFFSGHHHPGIFGCYRDLPFVTIEGMIETQSQNAYAFVEIYDDKIIVNGVGRVTSRELYIR